VKGITAMRLKKEKVDVLFDELSYHSTPNDMTWGGPGKTGEEYVRELRDTEFQ